MQHILVLDIVISYYHSHCVYILSMICSIIEATDLDQPPSPLPATPGTT